MGAGPGRQAVPNVAHLEAVEIEAHAARLVTELGISTPRFFERVEVDGRHGLIFKRVEGITMPSRQFCGQSPYYCFTGNWKLENPQRPRSQDEDRCNEACLHTPKCAHCYNCSGMPVNIAAGMQTRPSRLYLPKFDSAPDTIFEYLLARFPQVDVAIWHERVSRGLITLSDGTTLEENSPYRHGMTVFYRKEVPSEPPLLEEPLIVYRDDEILIVDKPHGMPVTPSGEHIERSLFVRLQRITGLPDLAPIHRLDRDTAGLLLFTIKADARAHYHRLFAEGRIEREYLAVAHVDPPLQRTHWRIENRIEAGEPWYRQRIVEGRVNAITEIELADLRSGLGRFRLFPKSGKKHQLRIHMVSIGCPIVGDPFYPGITKERPGDPPMQLLATRLAFIDPLTGTARSFTSARTLSQFS
jgi:tRNA pseudouridine32 synthase/23S rRNA pseudouridine746 synthase